MTDTEKLLQILEKNKSVQEILKRAENLGVSNWYLGSGGITQTVWNALHGFEPENGIKDYDFVYYDADDVSYEAEDAVIQKGKKLFKDIAIPVEIRNQARVHLWYGEHFGKQGKPIEQFKSSEEAIATWPTTATAIGVSKEGKESRVYAPFGLDDLFNLIVRANKIKVSRKVYQDKADRWTKIWPKLKVIPWD